MKKVTVRLALIGVFFVLPLAAFVWILNNATLFFSRLAPDGEWGFYATRADMMQINMTDLYIGFVDGERFPKTRSTLHMSESPPLKDVVHGRRD